MTAPRFTRDDVRDYYDRHTPGFVRRGQGGGEGALHRAVWGPGVADRRAAFHFVDDRILHWASRLDPVDHVVDLGCGVGGSACYVASRLAGRVTGVTLSPVQVQLAAERARASGLSDRVRFVEADFTELPASVEAADLAYAIESFVHAASAGAFFRQAAALVRPGGLLVVCDDFLGAAAPAGATDRFARGWHVNALVDHQALRAAAGEAGFEVAAIEPLSPWLELHRGRDRAARALLPLVAWIPGLRRRIDFLLGGVALQECLSRGWITYDLAVFKRLDARPGPGPGAHPI